MNDQSSTFPVTAGDINIYDARPIADQQVTYVVECADSLDIDRVRRSLTVLYEALPILSTVISVDGFHFQRVQVRNYQPALRTELECENG